MPRPCSMTARAAPRVREEHRRPRMPGLHDTQTAVMDVLLGRGTAPAGLLRTGTRPGGEQRLQVYRNSFVQGLTAALRAVYPVLDRLVGEDYFDHLARLYLGAHPPHAATLQAFGHALPGFVATLDSAATLPYLGDVAALEWAYHLAWHARTRPPLAPQDLAAVPPQDQPRLVLQLQPGARFVRSAYPVLAIWQANQPDAREGAAISLGDGGVELLVVQHELDVEFHLLARAESAWLRALAAGGDLSQATAVALGADPGFDLVGTLLRHLQRGLFCGWSLAEDA
ncbi:MAG: DUF2063 domain-containing protein [Aquabacterium sp.]|nr:MAG: DUF2063 domain-containing protein [Aquabacterium sp.]